MGENLHAGHRQRLKARYRAGGMSSLEEHEQLEMLLFYAIPRCDTNATAHRLLRLFGNLSNILEAPPGEIERVPGLGKEADTFFRFLHDVYGIYEARDRSAHPVVRTPADAARLLSELYSDWETEMVSVLLMDEKNRLIYVGPLNSAQTNWVDVDNRDLVQMVLNYKADKLILGHNHPSGDVRPSQVDLLTHTRLESGFSKFGLNLMDHIILCPGHYHSLLEHGEVFLPEKLLGGKTRPDPTVSYIL